MKNLFSHLVTIAFLATVSIVSTQAAETGASVTTATKPASESTRLPRDWYPFRGEVVSVDAVQRTLSLHRKQGVRVVRLEEASALTRAGETIAAGDIRIGEYAHGKLRKNDQGMEEIVAAAFEPEPPVREPKATRTRKPSVRKNPTAAVSP